MIYNNLAYGFKKIIKTNIFLIATIILLAISVCIGFNEILSLQTLAVNWPIEILSLCGMSQAFGFNASLMFFYIAVIILNIIAVACCAGLAVNIIKQDERNGMIIHYLNQPYNKIEILIIKIITAIFFTILQWILYITYITVAIYFICTRFNIVFAKEYDHIMSIATKGIPILFLALAICLLYSRISANRMGYIYFLITASSFSLLIGNAYKLFDLIGYYMRSGQVDDSSIMSISETLKKLRLFFPFTSLNRLNTEKQPLPDSATAIYLILSVLIIVLYGYVHMTKPVENND